MGGGWSIVVDGAVAAISNWHRNWDTVAVPVGQAEEVFEPQGLSLYSTLIFHI